MAANDAFAVADTPFGPVGLAGAARARRHPGARGGGRRARATWSLSRAAARRGVGGVGGAPGRGGHGRAGRSTSLDGLGHRVQIPAHRVLAVVEAPFGAHPGGLYAPELPVGVLRRGHRVLDRGARPPRGATSTPGPATGCSSPPPTTATSSGSATSGWTGSRRAPTPSPGGPTPRPTPSTPTSPPSGWEHAAVLRRRESSRSWRTPSTPTPCWPAPASPTSPPGWRWRGRRRGRAAPSRLTAELGMWGYTPTPADPYIFNHRVFPGTPMLADASTVLGMVVGGRARRTVACLGAAQVDRDGNLNSTAIPGGPVPGGVGRRQRRGQPGRGLCRGGAGPSRPAGRAGGLRDEPGAQRGGRSSPTSGCCAGTTACCGSRRWRPERCGSPRAGRAGSPTRADGTWRWPGRWRSSTRSAEARCWPCVATTPSGSSSPDVLKTLSGTTRRASVRHCCECVTEAQRDCSVQATSEQRTTTFKTYWEYDTNVR